MATILIVEDELPISELIKRNLQLVGHTCHCVFNGEDAVLAIERQNFDMDDLHIDFDSRQIFHRGQSVDCTPNEKYIKEMEVAVKGK